MRKKIWNVFALSLVSVFLITPVFVCAELPLPEAMLFQGNSRFQDYLTVGNLIDYYTFPTARGLEGQILIMGADGELVWGFAQAPQIDDNSITTQKLADGAVTEPKLAANSVTTSKIGAEAVTASKIAESAVGNGLQGGAGDPLSVDLDDTTIELGPEGLQVKDSGIVAAKINDGEITASKLRGESGLALENGVSGQVLSSLGDGAFSWEDTGGIGIPRSTSAYIVVEVAVGADAATNGENLLFAYGTVASPLFYPNGASKSNDNRAVVLVPPGQYNLQGMELELVDFVDVVGLSSSRNNQFIFGNSDAVIRQNGTNVRIENLTVKSEASGSLNETSSDPAAYFPDSFNGYAETVVRNCEFIGVASSSWSMRVGVEYDGTYENVVAGDYSFGGFSPGVASGNFLNCTGGTGAFAGAGGTASGTFRFCDAGDQAFGGGSGEAIGIFRSCEAGLNSFGGGGGSTAEGSTIGFFWDCVGETGSYGIGGYAKDCLLMNSQTIFSFFDDRIVRSPQ